jgi:hypothetical protein
LFAAKSQLTMPWEQQLTQVIFVPRSLVRQLAQINCLSQYWLASSRDKLLSLVDNLNHTVMVVLLSIDIDSLTMMPINSVASETQLQLNRMIHSSEQDKPLFLTLLTVFNTLSIVRQLMMFAQVSNLYLVSSEPVLCLAAPITEALSILLTEIRSSFALIFLSTMVVAELKATLCRS